VVVKMRLKDKDGSEVAVAESDATDADGNYEIAFSDVEPGTKYGVDLARIFHKKIGKTSITCYNTGC